MQLHLREAKKEDIPQLPRLYHEFTRAFVGSAQRSQRDFRRELRKKENINIIALEKNIIIGYIRAQIQKRMNRGEIEEIIVSPSFDFEQVAKLLVEKVQEILLKRKVASIIATSIRDPTYEKIFPNLGFFESESNSVFMYVILDVQKFLNESQPVLIARLKELKEKNILVQLECEERSIFLMKMNEIVQPFIFTNQSVDFKMILTREILAKLIFGIIDVVESAKTGQLKVESNLSEARINQILRTMFPRKQFLIMDYW